MTIGSNITRFFGKRVIDWPSKTNLPASDFVYRIRMSWDETDEGKHWTDKFAEYIEDPIAKEMTALVVGIWDYEGGASDEVLEAIVAAHRQLPNLKAIFFGDITYEENEISWIANTDMAPIFTAYPDMEHFQVRGANGLGFGKLHHDKLKTLIIESGGLPAHVVREVMAAELPQLEHLELWLGTPDYGGDATVEDLAPLPNGELFPKLRYLGLKDSEMANEVAKAVANAPIMERIEVLDMSMGTLTDEGAEALLQSPYINRLKMLDLHHHYCSNEMVEKLDALDIRVDTSEQEISERDDGRVCRYVAVGE